MASPPDRNAPHNVRAGFDSRGLVDERLMLSGGALYLVYPDMPLRYGFSMIDTVALPGPGHSGRVLPETYFRSVFSENATVKAGSPGGRSQAGVSGRGIWIAVFRDLLRRGPGCRPGGSGDWTVSGIWTGGGSPRAPGRDMHTPDMK